MELQEKKTYIKSLLKRDQSLKDLINSGHIGVYILDQSETFCRKGFL